MKSQIRRNLIARQSGEHLHDFSQILIGWRGEMACEFSEGGSHLKNGRYAIVPEQEGHLFSGLSDDSELLVIDINPEDPLIVALEEASNIKLTDTLLQAAEFSTLPAETSPILEYTALKLKQNTGLNSQQLNCQFIPLLLMQLWEQASSHNDQPNNPDLKRKLDLERLNQVIEQHIARQQSLDNQALADLFHLSASHFHCLFQRQFGMTPQAYVMARRLERVKRLLMTTSLSLSVIAEETGFADASSLSRAYKRHFGTTPGKARRLLSQKLRT